MRISDWSSDVCSSDLRAEIACIGRERADLVVAGCAILESIIDLWPAARVGVADRGIREGILRKLAMQGRDIPVPRREYPNRAAGTAEAPTDRECVPGGKCGQRPRYKAGFQRGVGGSRHGPTPI